MFSMLAEALKPEHHPVDAMDLLVQACTSCTDAVAADVLFSDPAGKLSVVAASGQNALDVEEEQLRSGKGPSIWSVHAGKPLEIAEIGLTRGVWPSFAERAEAHGFHASQTVPMRLRNHTLGGITLFFDHRGAVTNRDLALGHTLAQTAIVTLVEHGSVDRQGITAEKLQDAVETRALISHAQRTLAEQHRLTTDEALASLRASARRDGIGLSEMAGHVTALKPDSDIA
jgi:hypothetical protein